MTPRPNLHKAGTHRPATGRLVAVEGLDGCGKTTVARELVQRLRSRGERAVRTNWNETVTLYDLTTRLTESDELDGRERMLLGAAELAARWDHVIRPALDADSWVVATKYLVAPAAHATLRGQYGPLWQAAYGFAPRPDLTLHLRTSPETGLARKGGRIGYWEAGLDLADPQVPVSRSMRAYAAGAVAAECVRANFLDFQSRLRDAQDAILNTYSPVHVIDAEQPLDQVLAAAESALASARRPSSTSSGDAETPSPVLGPTMEYPR